MASADAVTAVRNDWAPSNPWAWMLGSLGATGLALTWVRLFGAEDTPLRITLALVGALAAAAALALRLGARGGAFLETLSSARRSLALLGLTAANLGLVAWAGGILVASLSDLDVPWGMKAVVVLWVLIFPAATGVALYAYHHYATGKPVGARAEGAILCLLASASLFMACWALYVDNLQAEHLDTLRLLLAVLALAAFVAVPVVALPTPWRRLAISLIILFHFGGIVTATLSPPPSAWLTNQAYVRIYRPYLEFIYLTNAYHFYAPEPGPSNYLWCRIEYVNAQGEHYSHWRKFADLDDAGHQHYPTALNYQRRIAMTDNIRGFDTAPQMLNHPIYFWRQVNSPTPPEPLVGRPNPRGTLLIPFHPGSLPFSQYVPANHSMKVLMSSYARHIASLPHPEHPHDKVDNVKIYWVVHSFAPLTKLTENWEPGHPTTYYPYYHGKFDREGKLLDEPELTADGTLIKGDPFLYWQVPILAEDGLDNQSAIYNWMFKHAGERNWYRPYGAQDYGPAPAKLEEAVLGGPR